jgi:hypothetical protein
MSPSLSVPRDPPLIRMYHHIRLGRLHEPFGADDPLEHLYGDDVCDWACDRAVPAGGGRRGGHIKAFSVWQGQGNVIQTRPNEATFVGAISGTVYVETEKGPVDAGQMICPAMIRINLEDGSQNGTGRCNLIGEDDARVFADVSCTGVHLVGCTGDFTLTGGAGRFAGITGGGPVTFRGGFREIVSLSGPAVQEAATGIIFWPALHYKIP